MPPTNLHDNTLPPVTGRMQKSIFIPEAMLKLIEIDKEYAALVKAIIATHFQYLSA